jgi:hypothetical protein
MPQFGASLTDDSRVIIYDCNVFIIQASVVVVSHLEFAVFKQ